LDPISSLRKKVQEVVGVACWLQIIASQNQGTLKNFATHWFQKWHTNICSQYYGMPLEAS
jgi:hypothetical protein